MFKLETPYAILYLIVSIVIPPLFVINLILFVVQFIIQRKKQQNEKKLYEDFENSLNEKCNILTNNKKKDN